MGETLRIISLDDFLYGRAPEPIRCGRGVEIGCGPVVPEINFTLPAMDIVAETWPEVRRHYTEMIRGVLARAVELELPSLVVEFETLPPMTVQPAWGLEITELLAEHLEQVHARHGLATALRLTPNDAREFERPPRMRSGPYADRLVELLRGAAGAGADLIAIESTGGKELSDDALVLADLEGIVFALGVLGARDMEFLWSRIVREGRSTGFIPSGDSACGFANTAMVLAERKMIPRLLAAVVRVASVPRSLVACRVGAVGPSKDCAYEGPYLKAIAGIPISMEGRSAACAHLSPVGNISQAVCDCWSNESVQNVQLLSGKAPVVSLEQLVYDCRLLNTAASASADDARRLRDWLVDSDAALDPQAYVLRPDVVLRVAAEIAEEPTVYGQTCRAVRATLEEIRAAHRDGSLRLAERDLPWLDRLRQAADSLPEGEDGAVDRALGGGRAGKFLPEEYGLAT